MYSYVFRSIYHKTITVHITKCFEGGIQIECIINICIHVV